MRKEEKCKFSKQNVPPITPGYCVPAPRECAAFEQALRATLYDDASAAPCPDHRIHHMERHPIPSQGVAVVRLDQAFDDRELCALGTVTELRRVSAVAVTVSVARENAVRAVST
ncbi:hypothetical protein LCGC14_2667770 [marine sediment metagenome]|uniref:Uncharacterized protein n=1 Tax=marine sediment metagenome TaxID=412755 RepID=A0A0F8ZQ43_9ZZZZ